MLFVAHVRVVLHSAKVTEDLITMGDLLASALQLCGSAGWAHKATMDKVKCHLDIVQSGSKFGDGLVTAAKLAKHTVLPSNSRFKDLGQIGCAESIRFDRGKESLVSV